MSNLKDVSDVESSFSAAPLEPKLSPTVGWTDEIAIAFKGEATVSSDLAGMSAVTSFLQGCGAVDLISISLKFNFTASNCTLQAGFTDTGSSASLAQIAFLGSGYSAVSTNYNMGAMIEKELIPEGIYSRQIRPVSSTLPTLKFMFSCNKGVAGLILIRVKVYGPRRHYASLN